MTTEMICTIFFKTASDVSSMVGEFFIVDSLDLFSLIILCYLAWTNFK